MNRLLFFLLMLALLSGCGTDTEPATHGSHPDSTLSNTDSSTRALSVPDSLGAGAGLSPKSEPNDPRAYYYKRFSGNLNGDLFFSMHLFREGETLTGCYAYEHVGRPIPLRLEGPVTDSSHVRLRERDPDNPDPEAPSGLFEGNFFARSTVSGFWQAADGETRLPFLMAEDYPEGSVPITLRHFEKNTERCGEDQCLSINLIYPEIDPQVHPKLAQVFNQRVKEVLCRLLMGRETAAESKQMTLEAAADSAIEEFQKMKAAFGEEGIWRWTRECKVTLYSNDRHILSLALNLYDYSGGAHGDPYNYLLNFDLKTGKEISLSVAVPPASRSKMTGEALRYLKLVYGGSESQSLEDLGFLVSEREFSLSQNFYLTPAGIGFIYDPYEIGPYSMGFVEVFVPGRMNDE